VVRKCEQVRLSLSRILPSTRIAIHPWPASPMSSPSDHWWHFSRGGGSLTESDGMVNFQRNCVPILCMLFHIVHYSMNRNSNNGIRFYSLVSACSEFHSRSPSSTFRASGRIKRDTEKLGETYNENATPSRLCFSSR
jgi:hypothetical protein